MSRKPIISDKITKISLNMKAIQTKNLSYKATICTFLYLDLCYYKYIYTVLWRGLPKYEFTCVQSFLIFDK